MQAGILAAIALASTLVGACDDPERSSSSDSASQANVSATSGAPSHNWQYREGQAYGYAAALSEDDRKAGRAATQVFMFRYLGNRNGIYSVASDNALASCANPCQVVTIGSGYAVQRMTFDPDSIIGEVFTDAFNGQLQVYQSPTAAAEPTSETMSSSVAVDQPIAPAHPSNETGDLAGAANSSDP